MDIDQLRVYDEGGYRTLQALAHARAPRQSTHSSPHAFICSGGDTFWVKRSAQHGLVTELVAGRLGDTVKLAPRAEVVDVPSAALPDDGVANHLLGVGVGVRDHGGFNPRELNEFRAEGSTFSPDVISSDARAAVIVFQTWIGAEDSQVLVDPLTGGLLSLDHGACLPEAAEDPSIVLTDIPGVSPNVGKDSPDGALDAVAKIQALDDDQLLRAFAGVPAAVEWQSAPERRLRMAQSLSRRKERLEEVISRWLQS